MAHDACKTKILQGMPPCLKKKWEGSAATSGPSITGEDAVTEEIDT